MLTNNDRCVAVFLHAILFMTSFADNPTTIIRFAKDVFTIPSGMCRDDTEAQCNSMGGHQRTKSNGDKVPCTCQCKNQTNNVFGRFDDQWKCEDNSVVRDLVKQGCRLFELFNGESADVPLKTVQLQQNRDSKIGTISADYDQYYNCWLDDTFSFLNCNSSWQQKGPNYPFFTQFDTHFHLYVHSKEDLDAWGYTKHVTGQIIKVQIKCTAGIQLSNKIFCMVFKVRGKKKCSVVFPTIPTQSSPTTNSPFTTTPTAPPTTAPMTLTTSSSPRPHLSTTQSTTHAKTFSLPPETKKEDSTTVHPSLSNGFTSPEKHNRRTSTDDNGGTSGIIYGVVGGLVGLIAILVILTFLWFKRKRRSHTKRATTQGTDNNAVYDGVVLDNHSSRPPGQLPSADEEYSYAYMNTHPIVIKDQNGTALQAPHLSNGQGNMKATSGPVSNSASSIYNTLEDPDYAKLNTAKEAPYNVLERQPEAGWKTPNSESPVYNIPEDPSYAKINKTNKKQQGCESSYNDLERGPLAKRNQKNEPFYDALEKPKSTSGLTKTSEAPIYNTLEDPNSDDFGDKQSSNGATNESPYYDVLENPNSTEENPIYNTLEDPNLSQESPVYNVLEGSSTASSPVYAELENPESEENHVYGALQNYDPHVYGALNSPTSTNVDFDYNDDYNNIGDVIYHNKGAVDSDVYQELNANGKISMEEQYQPLRHSNMFIDMKDMTHGEPQSDV